MLKPAFLGSSKEEFCQKIELLNPESLFYFPIEAKNKSDTKSDTKGDTKIDTKSDTKSDTKNEPNNLFVF